MCALRVVDVEVPKHARIRHIRSRMAFVTPVHTGELDGIADEKHRQVIKNKVMIALLGVELCRPSSDISDGIGCTFLSSNGRYAAKHFGLLADATEELGISEVGYIVGNFEFSPSSCCFGVDTPVSELACGRGLGSR